MRIETTDEFDEWMNSLDGAVRGRIAKRLMKLARGLWGNCKNVGGGVTELREDFGPGYRIYVVQRGNELVIVVGGGDKSSQTADINRAQEVARNL